MIVEYKEEDINDQDFHLVEGIWSSGMILALGARGLEFNSQNAPSMFTCKRLNVENNVFV